MHQTSVTCPLRLSGCAKLFSSCMLALHAVHCGRHELHCRRAHSLSTAMARCWQGTSARPMQATAGWRQGCCLGWLQIAPTPACGLLPAHSGGRLRTMPTLGTAAGSCSSWAVAPAAANMQTPMTQVVGWVEMNRVGSSSGLLRVRVHCPVTVPENTLGCFQVIGAVAVDPRNHLPPCEDMTHGTYSPTCGALSLTLPPD